MEQRIVCELCGAAVAPHAHYVVRIDVFADPTTPAMTSEELEEAGSDAMKKLIEQMQDMSAEELQDQVHRRFEFRLCPGCQRKFLANPLGLPRARVAGSN